MFTLPDKLPHDDQLPALEYVFHLATLIEPFEDFCGSPLLSGISHVTILLQPKAD